MKDEKINYVLYRKPVFKNRINKLYIQHSKKAQLVKILNGIKYKKIEYYLENLIPTKL